MIDEDIKLNYDDITIVPEVVTYIDSRRECNPYDKDGFLPIFAAPMSSVVSMENAKDFNDAKIRCVIPRSYSYDDRVQYLFSNTPNFVAFSLAEARELLIDGPIFDKLESYSLTKTNEGVSDKLPLKVCIDLANGHMNSLLELVKEIKDRWGNLVLIMTGNIANPETFRYYEEAGCDYVRVSIGTGDACTTSSNTAIHYPVFSLLKEIYAIRKEIGGKCKIIADGGIKGFGDIQKALIYADYVMIGSLFNRAIESAAKTTYGKSYFNVRGYKILRPFKTLLTYGKEIPREEFESVYKLVKSGKLSVWKEYFGQSTKIAQAIVASANSQTLKALKTSEGLFKYQKVEYDLKGWAENETDFLRSAMSYTDSCNLDEYKESQWVRISQRRYNN